MLFVIGIPLFFMELAIAQWYKRGFISLWKAVCPLASGKMDLFIYSFIYYFNGIYLIHPSN
jgi:hypothetical protein